MARFGHRPGDDFLAAALALVLALAAWPAPAQPFGEKRQGGEIVTVKRGGYTISGLVDLQPGAKPKRGIALFPGAPGIMKLRLEGGQPVFNLGGNFLFRTRQWWLDADTLTVAVDAPSDQWTTFEQRFRQTSRYGADVAALLQAIGARYGVEDWTFVGTSEGTVSAFHAARMNPALARRLILTSSLFRPSGHGPGLSDARWDAYRGQLLWVHHAEDPCGFTPYRDAQAFAKRSGAPLVTIRGGGPGQGPPCEPRSAHGYAGVQRPTVEAMRAWVRTGVVPADVSRP